MWKILCKNILALYRYCMFFFILWEYTNVTDGRTNGQTDTACCENTRTWRTDGQTDRQTLHVVRIHERDGRTDKRTDRHCMTTWAALLHVIMWQTWLFGDMFVALLIEMTCSVFRCQPADWHWEWTCLAWPQWTGQKSVFYYMLPQKLPTL